MKRDVAFEKLRALLPAMQAKYGVRSIAVFGSVARDEATDASDIDILVDLDERVSLLGFVELKLFLEDKLGVRVDIATRAALKPLIKPRIEAEAVRVA